jgi:hypothetical protein
LLEHAALQAPFAQPAEHVFCDTTTAHPPLSPQVVRVLPSLQPVPVK